MLDSSGRHFSPPSSPSPTSVLAPTPPVDSRPLRSPSSGVLGIWWGAAASVDALTVAMAVVSSVDVSAPFAESSAHSCARRSSSSSSLSTTARPFSRDSFACGEVRIGGVVDATDGGGGSGLTRSSSTFWSSRELLAGVQSCGDPWSSCPVLWLRLLHRLSRAAFRPSRPLSLLRLSRALWSCHVLTGGPC